MFSKVKTTQIEGVEMYVECDMSKQIVPNNLMG